MKSILSVLFLTVAAICSGNTLRISELVDAAGDGVERMTLKSENGEEVLFVKTQAVLVDTDVEQAWPGVTSGGQIFVKLNEDGGKKLRQITAGMQHGRDRLAIIVDGKLISAPVVHATLDSSFVISGFKDMEWSELDDLARRMSGKPPRPGAENSDAAKPLPRMKTVPFTEQEYQANKTLREKMGIFHIELVPTEEDLNKVFRKGMNRDEVVTLFGKPYMASDKPHDDNFYFIYQIAPEKRPDNLKREMLPDGFKVDFTGGKLSHWSHTYSSAQREEKVVSAEKPTLRATLPEIDVSSGDVDFVAFVEGIVVPDPKQSVNKRDLGDLISIAMMFTSSLDEDLGAVTLNADCDYMKTLSHNFSEIAALRREAKEGRVRVDKLQEKLSPYASGVKELPVKIKQAEQGGAEQTVNRSESHSEGDGKPQHDAEGRSR